MLPFPHPHHKSANITPVQVAHSNHRSLSPLCPDDNARVSSQNSKPRVAKKKKKSCEFVCECVSWTFLANISEQITIFSSSSFDSPFHCSGSACESMHSWTVYGHAPTSMFTCLRKCSHLHSERRGGHNGKQDIVKATSKTTAQVCAQIFD